MIAWEAAPELDICPRGGSQAARPNQGRSCIAQLGAGTVKVENIASNAVGYTTMTVASPDLTHSAARQPQEGDLSAAHLGFRTVLNKPSDGVSPSFKATE